MSEPARPSRLRRWLFGSAWATAGTLALAGAAAGWLLFTTAGARFVLERAAATPYVPAQTELGRRCLPGSGPTGLSQPGELEMVHGEGRADRQQPAGGVQGPDNDRRHTRQPPDLAAPRLPPDEQQHQADIGCQYVAGPLQPLRKATPQPRLHRLPGHHGVLPGEEEQQGEIDQDGRHRGQPSGTVDGPRNDHIGEEQRRPRRHHDEAHPGEGGKSESQRMPAHAFHGGRETTPTQPWNYRTSAVATCHAAI